MTVPTATTTRLQVLCDPTLDATLRDQGYVVVPLLDADEIESVRRSYEAIRPANDTGMAIDYSREDRTLVRQVTDLLAEVWDRHLPGLFVDHQPLLSTFLTKYPGDDSAMRLHREPTYTEPALDDMHVIWVPLVDVTAAAGNGALELVPGTQHLPAWLSGHDTPEVFRPYEAYLRRHSRSVDLPAGTAIVFHARMLHHSPTNIADTPRMAFGAVMTRSDSQLLHVVATGRRGREVFAIDRDFITDCHPTDVRDHVRANYPLLRLDADDTALTPAQVAAAVGSAELPERQPSVPEGIAAQLAHAGRPMAPLPSVPVAGLPRPDHDLTVGVADLAPSPDPVAGVEAASGTRRAAVAPLAAALQATDLGEMAALTERPEQAAAVVVETGGRLELDLTGPQGWAFTVYECPVVHSGLFTPDAIGQFEVGERIQVPPGHVTLWNQGPGPLWAVLAPDEVGAAVPAPTPDSRPTLVERLRTRRRRPGRA